MKRSKFSLFTTEDLGIWNLLPIELERLSQSVDNFDYLTISRLTNDMNRRANNAAGRAQHRLEMAIQGMDLHEALKMARRLTAEDLRWTGPDADILNRRNNAGIHLRNDKKDATIMAGLRRDRLMWPDSNVHQFVSAAQGMTSDQLVQFSKEHV